METSAGIEQINSLKFLKQQALLIGLVVIIVFFSLATNNFFSVQNLQLIIQQAAVVGIASCGMTFVLVTGNFDLAMGANITLGVLLSLDLHDKYGPIAGIIAALAACTLVGAVSGFLIGYLRIHSMVITLGMMMILTGVMLVYTGGTLTWVNDPSSTWFSVFGRATISGIPIQAIFLIVLVGLFEFILKATTFGVKLQAVGGNANAVRYSGLNDRRTIMQAFILCGLLSGFAGIVMGSRNMQFQLGIAFGYEFDALSAVILGGTSLLGGSGSVVKSLIGVLIISSLTNGFLMIGLPYYFQWVVQGLVILFVVWMDVLSKKKEGLS